jgi:hypothetical protein
LPPVEAVGILILLENLADDHGTVFSGIDRDLAGRIGQRLAHDLDAPTARSIPRLRSIGKIPPEVLFNNT